MIDYIKNTIKHILLLKRFPQSKIYSNVNVDKNSYIGLNTVLFNNVSIQNTQIGDYTYVQSNSVISSSSIGKFCSIASNVHIGLAEHPMHLISTSPVFYDNTQPLPAFFIEKKESENICLPVEIKEDVWIGQSVIIKSGVSIGIGAVIAAGAVVVKDVEPYSIVGGVPAKHIKYRFDEILRNSLIQSKWWEYPDNKLIELSSYFNRPDELINFLKKSKNDII
jgi:acetyltransferase-like isoleucine patch superfamily enzyme